MEKLAAFSAQLPQSQCLKRVSSSRHLIILTTSETSLRPFTKFSSSHGCLLSSGISTQLHSEEEKGSWIVWISGCQPSVRKLLGVLYESPGDLLNENVQCVRNDF